MDKKRNYYLLVSVDDIYLKKDKNNVVVIDNGSAMNIFNNYNIPKEFQKIIIKISVGGITEPADAFELITDKMFYFKTPILKALLNPLANPVIEIFASDIGIVTENKIHHADIVKEFYEKIIDANLALDYGNAVREILDVKKEKDIHEIFTRIKKKK